MIVKKSVLLNVKGVNVTLDGKHILRDVNLQIRDIIRTGVTQGQVVSLVGRSGIGKSTLLNVLAGLLKPDTGAVILNQKEEISTGEVGMVSQDYYIYDWRKVKKILEMAVSRNIMLEEKDKQDYVNQIVDQFALTDHLNKFSRMLSGGQRQRVAIAEQVLTGNEFILFDEPFSGLDPLLIDKVLAQLLKVSLSDELKTLIIVSHDLINCTAISDTIFVLNTQEGLEGATIVKEIDLIEKGLAYHENIKEMPEFLNTIKEVKELMA